MENQTTPANNAMPRRVSQVLLTGARRLLAAGIESGRLDAELLLGHVLGMSREQLVIGASMPLSQEQWQSYESILLRRLDAEPTAYITGRQEFWSKNFCVTPDVLIPRPETECLVEIALKLAAGWHEPLRILDLGTGSGAIAIALAGELPKAEIFATDISHAALIVARQNAAMHGVAGQIHFLQGDLFEAIRKVGAKFHLISSNPPYIRRGEIAELAPTVSRWEPRGALDGGPDGLDYYRRLAAVAMDYLLPNGAVIVEIGADMGVSVRALFADAAACVDATIASGLQRPRSYCHGASSRIARKLSLRVFAHGHDYCSGRQSLAGAIAVSGAKNAALPILISSLLTAEPCTYQGVPHLADIRTTFKLLSGLGDQSDNRRWLEGADELTLCKPSTSTNFEAPYDLVKTMRASFLVLGPLVARFGTARVSTPGGCAIGARPINLHLKGLEALGATIEQTHGYIEAKAKKLHGAKIYLDLPSVGATENLMMAAALADGTTILENAAKEPEIEDLANALNGMGGQVHGAGGDIVHIEGVKELHGVTHRIIPDRIEAGSFVIAAALTGGEVLVKRARAAHLDAFLIKLDEAGVTLSADDERHPRAAQRQYQERRCDHVALPRLSHRSAGAVNGAHGGRRRRQRYHRNDFRKSFHACAGAGPYGRANQIGR